jgi:lipopolysaccharide assembly protein A
MRWLYLTVVILFAAAILIFALQNLVTITISFLGFSMSAPIAVWVFAAYVLGAATGGSLYALLRRSYEGSGILRSGHG